MLKALVAVGLVKQFISAAVNRNYNSCNILTPSCHGSTLTSMKHFQKNLLKESVYLQLIPHAKSRKRETKDKESNSV